MVEQSSSNCQAILKDPDADRMESARDWSKGQDVLCSKGLQNVV